MGFGVDSTGQMGLVRLYIAGWDLKLMVVRRGYSLEKRWSSSCIGWEGRHKPLRGEVPVLLDRSIILCQFELLCLFGACLSGEATRPFL